MVDVDQTITQIERLYRTLTGIEPPPQGATPYTAIPPEKDPERHVEEQLDRLFTLLTAAGGASLPQQQQIPAAAWTPAIAVWEGPQEYLVTVDVPGVPRSTLNVTVFQNTLVIRGERPRPAADPKAPLAVRWMERPIGTFVRVLRLPEGASPDQLEAQLRDGVLEIRMPRVAPSVGAKTISVHAAV